MKRISPNVLLLCTLVASLATAAEREFVPVLEPSPETIEQMDRDVRDVLDTVQGRLDQLLSSNDATAEDLTRAFGDLGELYLVYSLPEAAASCFENARRLAPEEAKWPYLLGAIHERAGETAMARSEFELAKARAPGDRPTLVRLARLDLVQGDLDQAEAKLTRLLDEPEFEAVAHFELGRLEAERGQFTRAAEHLEAVLALQPEASVARYRAGLAYRELGDLERAREYLSRWGRSEVTFPDPLFEDLGRWAVGSSVFLQTATLARAQGDPQAVVEAYRLAVKEAPEDISIRRQLASALVQAGDRSGAMAEYQEILEIAPADASTLYNLGTELARDGQLDSAISLLQRAVASSPEDADARVNLARLLADTGDLPGAEALYREAIEVDAYDPDTKLGLAEILIRQQNYAGAEEILDRLKREDPNSAQTTLALAELHDARKDLEQAAELYREALKLDATGDHRARAHFGVGRIYARSGRAELALPHLAEAAELSPNSFPVRLTLANLLGQLGRLRDSAAAYREAADLDPKNVEARFGGAVALLLAGLDSDATGHLEQSVLDIPQSVRLRHLLARVLATAEDARVRDGARALALAESVFRAEQTIEHAETLAMAHAELGQFEQALGWQTEVVARARGTAAPPLLRSIERRFALYEQGKPCRTPWRESE